MSDLYPSGGTPPTSFKPVHAITDVAQTHPNTEASVSGFLIVAAVVIGVGLLLWGIIRLGRSHV